MSKTKALTLEERRNIRRLQSQKRRSDPEYRAKERERNAAYQRERKNRQSPAERAAARQRHTELTRRRRSNLAILTKTNTTTTVAPHAINTQNSANHPAADFVDTQEPWVSKIDGSVERSTSNCVDIGLNPLLEPVLSEELGMVTETDSNDQGHVAEAMLDGSTTEITNSRAQEIDFNSRKEATGCEETVWYICTICHHTCLSLNLLIIHKRQVHATQRTNGAVWRISQDDLLTLVQVERIEEIGKALENLQKASTKSIRFKPISTLVEQGECAEDSTTDRDTESDFSTGSKSKEMAPIVKVERTANSTWSTKGKSNIRNTTESNSEKPFSCKDCKKRFTNNMLLRKHRNAIHERELKFECPECNQKFRLPSELKSHSLIHSGILLSACDICGRQFARRSTMLCHRITHAEGNVIIHPHTSETQGIGSMNTQTEGATSKQNIQLSVNIMKHDIPEYPESISIHSERAAYGENYIDSPQYDDLEECDFGYSYDNMPLALEINQTISHDSQQVDSLVQVKEEPIDEMDIPNIEADGEWQDPSYFPSSLLNSHGKSSTNGMPDTQRLTKTLRNRIFKIDPEEGDNSTSSEDHHSEGTSETKLQVKKGKRRGDRKRDMRSKEHKSRKCVICEKEFNKRSEVSDHQVNEHGGTFIFECELCNSRYISIKDLISHEKVFHKEEELKEKGRSSTVYQELLTNKSDNGEALKKFIKSLEEVYKCPKCYKCFSATRRHRYNEHVQYVHIKICERCGWFGGTRSELKNHIDTVHANEKDLLCQKCGKSFVTAGQLKNHTQLHQKYQTEYPCNICGKVFNMGNNLNTHQMIVHNIGDKSKRFQCHLCPRGFWFKGGLEAHVLAHSNPLRKVRTIIRPKIVPCPKCDAKFAQRDSLRSHLRNIHRSDNYNPDKVIRTPPQIGLSTEELTCKVCGKTCKFASELRQHMRKHTNERPFTCDICGKCFKRSLNLSDHKRYVHMSVSGNTCDICGVEVSGKEIRHHKMEVHGLASRCEVCGKAFTTARLLKQHSAVHLSDFEKPFRCELCGKGFCQKQQLQIHQKSHSK